MEHKLNIDKSNWQLTKLGDIAKEISERVADPSASEYDRFVGLGNFVSGDLKIKNWETTENLSSSGKAFKKGDILFARRNAYLRRASLVEFNGVCSGDAFVLRENHDKIVPGFLAFVVNANGLWDYANANAAGTMSKRVKWRDLANYEFLLPPLEDQARLAELLWVMDAVVEKEKGVLEKLEVYYKCKREFSILKDGTTLSFKYNTRLKEDINSNIKLIPLSEVLSDIRYGTSKKASKNNSGTPIIGIPNVIQEKLSLNNLNYVQLEKKESSTCILHKGDIVIVRTNGNPEYTGRSAIYDLEEEHAFASYLIKISIDYNILDPQFLVRYLQTNTARRYFKRNATSTAGNYNINTEIIKRIPIPIISKTLQQKIISNLKIIESNINLIKDTISRSESLQKSLINQIF